VAAVLFVAVNAVVVLYGVGLDFEPFSWKAFAQVYTPPGIDPSDVIGQNDNGCFYETETGLIISGGSISASGPGVTVVDDGADGCYLIQIEDPGPAVAGLSGGTTALAVDLTIEMPLPGFGYCELDATCPEDANPLFVPQGSVIQVGALPAGNGFLTAPGCTAFRPTIVFIDGFLGSAVIANNIALTCDFPEAPAPVLSIGGWIVAGALLLLAGFIGLRSRSRETS
jgi:hypothetical protein